MRDSIIIPLQQIFIWNCIACFILFISYATTDYERGIFKKKTREIVENTFFRSLVTIPFTWSLLIIADYLFPIGI